MGWENEQQIIERQRQESERRGGYDRQPRRPVERTVIHREEQRERKGK